MTPEAVFERNAAGLTRRLEGMLGSRELAEDVSQEAFLRLWQRGTDGIPASKQAAWLRRTASNLAIDELRRRGRREEVELEEGVVEALAGNESEALTVRDALARLPAHQRLLVLLRFQAGLSHQEIADLLAITPEATRKRVAVARRAFKAAYSDSRVGSPPVILIQTRDDPEPYREWLAAAGAEPRFVRPGALEPQLAAADGIVVGGSVIDVHPSLYGEAPRVRLNDPDRERDLRDLQVTRAALEAALPFVGICKGAQLLNIALGGSLYQDLEHDGATRRSHWQVQHRVVTTPGSHARRVLGRGAIVASEHHQAARRIGRGLHGTSRSEDSVFESLELPGERLVMGLQWHPEHQESDLAGRRVAEALLDESAR